MSFNVDASTTTAIHPEEWDSKVKTGYALQGKLCFFGLKIDPIVRWGDSGKAKKSTAGWLAKYAVIMLSGIRPFGVGCYIGDGSQTQNIDALTL